MNKEQFDLIKKKYGHYASWAIWAEEGDKPKSNMGDLSIFEDKNILSHINPNIILVGLNISKRDEINRPFENFHGPLGGAYKIRYAFKNSLYWGGYMTDVIKDFAEKVSKKMMSYLKEDKIFEKENINSFLKELEDLESNNPTIIAFGNDAYSVLIRNLKNRKYFIKVPIWMGYIAGYILDIIARFTNIIFPFSLRRLKAMTRDVLYSNKKILHVLNVKNKYGVQQGIKFTVEWYHQNGIL